MPREKFSININVDLASDALIDLEYGQPSFAEIQTARDKGLPEPVGPKGKDLVEMFVKEKLKQVVRAYVKKKAEKQAEDGLEDELTKPENKLFD